MSAEFNVSGPQEDPLAGDSPSQPPSQFVPSPSRRSSRSSSFLRENLLLVVMFAAGILVVYGLNLKSGPAKASAQQLQAEQQVDTALSKLPSSDVMAKGKSKEIIDGFYQNARQRQIPLELVKSNPFIFHAPGPKVAPPTATQPTEGPVAPPTNTDLAAALGALKTLKLQSVLAGGHGKSLAMISNNLLAEGQTISGWTITKISAKEVVLTWRDQTQKLTIGD